MNARCCIVLIGILWICVVESSKRQRIIFINEAPESVFFTIGFEPLPTLEREEVLSGERRYFFPEYITEENDYFIQINSMYHQVQYRMHLHGNLQLSSVRSCHAYGELLLMRSNLIMQTLGASSLAQGIILRYTHEYELVVELVEGKKRPHLRSRGCLPCSPCRR